MKNNIVSAAELLKMEFDPFERVKFWKVFPRSMALELRKKDAPAYWIDLEQCRNSAAVLDWIVQVSKKGWVTPEIIGDLVLALDACLGLQANFCSFGVDRGQKTKAELRQKVKTTAEQSRRVRKHWNRECCGSKVIYHHGEPDKIQTFG